MVNTNCCCDSVILYVCESLIFDVCNVTENLICCNIAIHHCCPWDIMYNLVKRKMKLRPVFIVVYTLKKKLI